MSHELLLSRINFVARCALAFVFIYHGLIPKILWQSSTEIALLNAHGLNVALLPIAGVFEVVLGVSFVLFRKSLMLIYLTAVILVVLLVDVAIVMPSLLTEAFNPVTINFSAIIFLYFIYVTQSQEK